MTDVLASQDSWQEMLQQIHPEDRESYTRSYQSLDQAGAHEIEYRVLLADGVVRHIHEASKVEFDSSGKAVSVFALLQDITERKIYQHALENREAMARQVESITDIGHFIFDLKDESYIYISQGFAAAHAFVGMELPPAPLELRLHLQSEEEVVIRRKVLVSADAESRSTVAIWARTFASTFNADREVELILPGPGRYRPVWTLFRESPTLHQAQRMAFVVGEFVEISEPGASLHLEPDPLSYAEALTKVLD